MYSRRDAIAGGQEASQGMCSDAESFCATRLRSLDGHLDAGCSGDAFLFKPGEAHQIENNSDEYLVLYVVADNPPGECCYYSDSHKWGVPLLKHKFIRSDSLDYYDGEE